MIRKRERRGGTDSRHVAMDTVVALLPRNVLGLIRVAVETLTIVRLGRVTLRVAVSRMTSGALDIAFQETGALHQAQRLESDIANVVFIA